MIEVLESLSINIYLNNSRLADVGESDSNIMILF